MFGKCVVSVAGVQLCKVHRSTSGGWVRWVCWLQSMFALYGAVVGLLLEVLSLGLCSVLCLVLCWVLC